MYEQATKRRSEADDFLLLFSWHDGDPEYLNDLDRQVMQKERLRQVRLAFSAFRVAINITFFFRFHVSATTRAVAITSRHSTPGGVEPGVVRRR